MPLPCLLLTPPPVCFAGPTGPTSVDTGVLVVVTGAGVVGCGGTGVVGFDGARVWGCDGLRVVGFNGVVGFVGVVGRGGVLGESQCSPVKPKTQSTINEKCIHKIHKCNK